MNKTTTVVMLMAVTAGIIGIKTGFWSRLAGAIAGTMRVRG